MGRGDGGCPLKTDNEAFEAQHTRADLLGLGRGVAYPYLFIDRDEALAY